MSNEDDLSTTIRTLAERLQEAAKGLVTVEVRTLIGNAALSENATKGDQKVPLGTEGAYTACNMATGDITACFSDSVATSEQVQALHEEAVERGTKIFHANMELLKKLLLELLDKQRDGG
jgi:hypothetical protein